MKTKAIIATVLLTTGIGFGAVSTPVNAATWHKGMPKILQGKCKTKTWKPYKQFPNKGRAYLKISDYWFGYQPALPPVDPMAVQRIRYRRSGNIYHVIGRETNNAPKGGILQTFTIKVYNRQKLYFRFNQSRTPDINHVYYKY